MKGLIKLFIKIEKSCELLALSCEHLSSVALFTIRSLGEGGFVIPKEQRKSTFYVSLQLRYEESHFKKAMS